MKKTLYMGGGWFNPQQEEEHSRIYELLKDKYEVFNPKLANLVKPDSSADFATQAFIGNIDAIRNSDIVVIITDYKDMGTIWEAGYTYANCKPIIYYAETLGDRPFNLMLAKTGLVSRNEQELLEKLADEKSYKFHVINNFEGNIE